MIFIPVMGVGAGNIIDSSSGSLRDKPFKRSRPV